MDKLPPTQVIKIIKNYDNLLKVFFGLVISIFLIFQDALLQHARRAVYQAGIWAQSTEVQMVCPDPQDFGWSKIDDTWVPTWITIPEVSRACRELIKCCCEGDCSHCKRGKANLSCTPLCKCKCNSEGYITFLKGKKANSYH